jgi:hypothetical protein
MITRGTRIVLVHNLVQQATQIYILNITTNTNMQETLFLEVNTKSNLLALIFGLTKHCLTWLQKLGSYR